MGKEEKRILIISGGKAEDDFIAGVMQKECYDMIIAADSGLTAGDRLKLPLDFIVGDFDSVEAPVLQKYKEKSVPIETYPKEKDKTDTQIAIELALKHSPACIDIVAATGCRLDHVLANIHLLLPVLQQGISAHILDPNNKVYLKNESFHIRKEMQYGNYISFLPFTEKVIGLSLTGFKYPLDNIILKAGSSLGISNEINDDDALVEFTEGILLVIESRD